MLKTLFTIFFFYLLIIPVCSQAVLNVEKLGQLNPSSGHGFSSGWGYTAPNGREYGLLGVDNGTSIIDITNPATPVQVAFIPGPSSSWREMKTWGTYAYIVTEGTGTGKGLQIVDLSNLPVSATLVNTMTTYFNRAHDISVEQGYAYIVGTDTYGGGMHILDLSNPTNPTRTGVYTASGYIHDTYIWRDTVYASSEDTYDLVNVTNKTNPQLISKSAALPGIYAHSGWLTEDKRYFVAMEEFNVRDLTVWDLQDRTSWNLVVSQWQMPGNSPIHNCFIRGKYAHISYYKEGYIVLDVSNPLNPTLVGQYDTYLPTSGTYAGAWNCYPYFPSKNIIITDMQTGLWVFKFLLDPIPVELTSFTYDYSNSSVILKWATATETNNKGFEIQKSIDNKEWKQLTFVNGFGTTTLPQNYIWSDYNAENGKSFYRLIQHDFDGTKKIYDAIEVNIAHNFELNQNFPNPFNPKSNIKYQISNRDFVTLKVFDVLGNEVATLVDGIKEAGNYEVEFTGDNLSSGVYLARLTADNFTKTIKMVLKK